MAWTTQGDARASLCPGLTCLRAFGLQPRTAIREHCLVCPQRLPAITRPAANGKPDGSRSRPPTSPGTPPPRTREFSPSCPRNCGVRLCRRASARPQFPSARTGPAKPKTQRQPLTPPKVSPAVRQIPQPNGSAACPENSPNGSRLHPLRLPPSAFPFHSSSCAAAPSLSNRGPPEVATDLIQSPRSRVAGLFTNQQQTTACAALSLRGCRRYLSSVAGG